MPKSTYLRGEILPPASQPSEVPKAGIRETGFPGTKPLERTSNEDLNYIATWLDDRFEVPGLGIRFGLDALIGWIPGIGDALAAAASLFIVFAAWKRGAQRITVLRMMLNLTIEDTIGAIPILGDFAHVAWKANRRNYNLLIRDQQSLKRHTWQDWLFVVCALTIMTLLFLAPFLLLAYLLRSRRSLP
ncbi:MAG TPA: DUF4112 domain-containing protein [Candidatus Sulfotelmatobacter sp.]